MGVSERPPNLTRRTGAYGVDAPYVPILLGVAGLLLLGVAGLNAAHHTSPWAVVTCSISGVWFLACAACYLYTTRIGKFAVWAGVLRGLRLRGDEGILDLGCGRGAVLLAIAKLLPCGRAVGVDLWKAADQSGNSIEMTRRNAAHEGVAARVELATADMRALPFADGTFDVVVSSLAIHNIPDAAGRAQAMEEALRVLKPGGRLLIADIRAARQYRDLLRQVGMVDVATRPLGWRFWYGGPWMATTLVTATKQA